MPIGVLDIASDCQYFDGTATVTHWSKRESGDRKDNIRYARKQAAKQQDSSGTWFLSSNHCTWFLPDAECAYGPPKSGDVIEESDGTKWNLQDAVKPNEITGLWECFSVKQKQ